MSAHVYQIEARKDGVTKKFSVSVCTQWRNNPLYHAYVGGLGTSAQFRTAAEAIDNLFTTAGYRVLTDTCLHYSEL